MSEYERPAALEAGRVIEFALGEEVPLWRDHPCTAATRVNGPSRDVPWLEDTYDALRVRPHTTLIYLLVDIEGAKDIAHGIVPRYVKRDAKAALTWNFAD
jgi:hypothetical protein